MRQLLDEHYPDAARIRVVLDNFSTHTEYAFYEFLSPTEARQLLEKLEFHFTPPHGSWLNMAEIELGALASQCLDRRIPDAATLRAEVAAWERTRNEPDSTIDWQFTTDGARIKLRRLYPVSVDD
jgi:3-methyladenine DNA glycosylase AlkC